MHCRGKNKLYIIVGLTFLLISMSILLISLKTETRYALTILSSLIITMAIISMYVSYIQIERMKKRLSSLPENYQIVYLDANELVDTYGILKVEKEEIMNMILEIFEHASLEDREVDEVVGGNLAIFIEGFITETEGKHTLLYLFSYSTILFIGLMLLIKAYKLLLMRQSSMYILSSETIDLGLMVTYLIISYIVFPWVLLIIRRSIKNHWKGIKRVQILVPLIIPLGLFMGLILINDPSLINIIEYPIPLFSNIWSIGLGILLLFISLLLTNLKKGK